MFDDMILDFEDDPSSTLDTLIKQFTNAISITEQTIVNLINASL